MVLSGVGKSKEETDPFLNSYLGQFVDFWVTAK